MIIDITRLNTDHGFGFNKYLPSNSNSSDQNYQGIFESPYVDYRRGHSVAGSIYGGSDLLAPTNDKYQKELSKLTPVHRKSSPTLARKSELTDIFWKGFAIFLLVTFLLAIIVSLCTYFIYRSNWL